MWVADIPVISEGSATFKVLEYTTDVSSYPIHFETMITSVAEFHDALQEFSNGAGSPLAVARCEAVDETLTETLCAFANMPHGGSILIRTPQGQETAQALEAQIQLLAQHHVSPAIPVQFFRASFDDQAMLVVNVHRAEPQGVLCRVIATNAAYVRSEFGNHPLSVSQMQQLQDRHPGATPWDLHVVSATGRRDLDEALVEEFVEAARRDSEVLRQASDTEVLEAKGVLTATGQLTLAGLYALGRYPQQFFPNLRITAQRSNSAEPDFEEQRFDGPLPVLLEHAVRWVLRQATPTGHTAAHQAAVRMGPLPILAIRELITNALVHRDLSPHTVGQSVQLRLDDNELIVKNPGGLHRLSLEQLGREPHETAVNPSLYEICRFISVSGGHRLVDPQRSTLRNVHWALRRAGFHTPTYRDTGLHFTVAVGRRHTLTTGQHQWLATLPSHDRLATQQRYLLVSMSHGKMWDANALRREFGPEVAQRALAQLEHLAELGLVQTSEGFGSTSYGLVARWLRDDAERFDHKVIFQPVAPQAQPHDAESSGAVSPVEPQSQQDYDGAARAAAVSKHGATLWNVLSTEPMNIHDIAQAAQLSLSQTRYGIQRLVAEGLVQRTGGQGHRETTYRRADESGDL